MTWFKLFVVQPSVIPSEGEVHDAERRDAESEKCVDHETGAMAKTGPLLLRALRIARPGDS